MTTSNRGRPVFEKILKIRPLAYPVMFFHCGCENLNFLGLGTKEVRFKMLFTF